MNLAATADEHSRPPLISVCMPVYNAERYIAEAVESILAQTYRDFEFIIIDDGSTDRSLAILERYAAQDVRIWLSSRPNAGLVVRLNEMAAEARSDVIAQMHADDIAMPERFARQFDFLNAHPEVVVVGCRTLAIDSDGDPLAEFCTIQDHEEIDLAHIEVRWWSHLPSGGDHPVRRHSYSWRLSRPILALRGHGSLAAIGRDRPYGKPA